MTTGRGFVADKEIETLTKAVIDEIIEETVFHDPKQGMLLSPHMVSAGLWRAIRAGALDDILYNRGVDFDEYGD